MSQLVELEESKKNIGFKSISVYRDQSLGIGSYGAVYKAKCDDLICAAKVLHPTLFDPYAQNQVAPRREHRLPLRRFEQECEVMGAIKHPNIVQFLGTKYDSDSNSPVLLMELMDDSLTHFLESSLQPVPYHLQVNFCLDIVLALSFLHSNGIIHRDLSSNNVLLIGNVRAKVTDFGMAKLHDFLNVEMRTRLTYTICPGTDVYMPPEAVKDNPDYNAKIDCFSFGVIIVQLLTSQFPKPGDRQEEIQLNLPGLSAGTIMRCVPEVERRQNHISTIDPNNPLLSIALNCLKDRKDERPSAHQLCEQVVALRQSNDYTESISCPNHGKSSGGENHTSEIQNFQGIEMEKDQKLQQLELHNQQLIQQLKEMAECVSQKPKSDQPRSSQLDKNTSKQKSCQNEDSETHQSSKDEEHSQPVDVNKKNIEAIVPRVTSTVKEVARSRRRLVDANYSFEQGDHDCEVSSLPVPRSLVPFPFTKMKFALLQPGGSTPIFSVHDIVSTSNSTVMTEQHSPSPKFNNFKQRFDVSESRQVVTYAGNLGASNTPIPGLPFPVYREKGTSTTTCNAPAGDPDDQNPIMQFMLHYDIQQSKLTVHLHYAKVFCKRGNSVRCDPFVILHLEPDRKDIFQSCVAFRTYDPVFDEGFQFQGLSVDNIRLQTLVFRFYNHALNSRAIGKASLQLRDVDLFGAVVQMKIREIEVLQFQLPIG